MAASLELKFKLQDSTHASPPNGKEHTPLARPFFATAATAQICLIFTTCPGRCAAASAMWATRPLRKFLRLGALSRPCRPKLA